jgi:hypothetical protein
MMEISKCVFKQKDDIHLSNGSRLMTVEFSHHSCEDEVNGHHYITQKSVPIQRPKFGPFTLTLIPKEVYSLYISYMGSKSLLHFELHHVTLNCFACQAETVRL